MKVRSFLVAVVLAALWAAPPASAQIELFQLSTVDNVPTRFDVRYEAGEGVGFDRDFTEFNLFLPVYQCDDVVLFSDTHYHLFMDGVDYWNLGGGIRTYVPECNAVVGLNAYFDTADHHIHTYHQVGIGWEILGEIFDLRGNVYVPVGDNRVALSRTLTPTGFTGFNLGQTVTTDLEVLARGVDVEAGVRLPSPERVVSRAYIGYYNYQGDGTRQLHGVRGRVETSIFDLLTLNFVVQNDRDSNWTAYGGVGIRFGGPSSRDYGPTVCDRRADPIERNPAPVLRPGQDQVTTLVVDPTTGAPLRIIHVDSNAPAGGNGTFEAPFQTLAAAQAGSMPSDVIFAHAGSTFTIGSAFALQSNQRFLGEGITQTVPTASGLLTLPRATGNTTLPILTVGAGSTGITLAQNNTVSGFVLNGAAGSTGILGAGNIGAFSIDRNTLTGFTGITGRGINFQDFNGSGLITSNTFRNNGFGIFFLQSMNQGTVGVRNNDSRGGTFIGTPITGGTLRLQLLNNFSTSNYTLQAVGGTLLLENTLGTNSPVPNTINATIVPFGTFGLP